MQSLFKLIAFLASLAAPATAQIVLTGNVSDGSGGPLLSGQVLIRASTVDGYEPWISDGTAAGTTMLKEIWSGTSSSSPQNFTPILVGIKAMFFAKDGSATGDGRELLLSR